MLTPDRLTQLREHAALTRPAPIWVPTEPGEIVDSRHSGNGIAHCFFQLSQDDFSWWMFQLRIPQAVFPGPEQTRRIVSYRARQIKMKPFFRRGVSP